jgi:hypothetical protein
MTSLNAKNPADGARLVTEAVSIWTELTHHLHRVNIITMRRQSLTDFMLQRFPPSAEAAARTMH